MSRLADLRRAFAFVRHVPFARLARRMELDVRRRWRDRVPGSLASIAAPAFANAPPPPLFAPRDHLAPRRRGNEWTFCFLNRTIAMQGPAIDWSAPGQGAANQLWRMNLHYMEYLEGVDDDVFGMFIDDWLSANGTMPPGAWRDSWNSYALSLRVVVWMQQLAARGDRVPAQLRAGIGGSIATQMRFLERNLETDLGGNHLVKNIKALLWASAFFTGDEAAHWRKLGLVHLEREIDHQVLPDGVHDERSPAYHNQVFADLLECRHALGGDPLGSRLDDALRRMALASADLVHPDGGVALFNDAGLSMAYPPAACLTVFARRFGLAPAARTVFAYPAAGYYGARGDSTLCIVDCGRIAPDSLPAHGHGDVLSFEWSVAGERLIVDPGVFEYVAGERRLAARSARSHNTLCLDGANQADFFGAFRCGRRPNVEVRRWEAREHGFLLEGAHDGFAYLPGTPIHVRQFDVLPRQIEIVDRIEGRTDRGGQIGFLLGPAAQASLTERGVEIRIGSTRVRVESSTMLAVEPAVWWPDMGVEQLTNRLVARFGAGAPEVRTRLSLL